MTSNEFVQELKLEFERLINLKDRLDTKANNMIAMSGTVTTLFMGFGIFLLTEVDITANYYLGLPASIILLAEVFLTFCTICFALESYKLRNYIHPLLSGLFFNENQPEPNETARLFMDSDADTIKNRFVIDYLKSIKSYEEQNHAQTFGINKAQKTFLYSLAMIPIFSVLVVAMVFFN